MQNNHTQTTRNLPVWMWCVVVAFCGGDAVTTLLAQRVGLSDYNPLYASMAITPWLLLLTHSTVLAVLATLVRHGRAVAVASAVLVIVLYGLGDLYNLLAILSHIQH